jgi:hypothetical protein
MRILIQITIISITYGYFSKTKGLGFPSYIGLFHYNLVVDTIGT